MADFFARNCGLSAGVYDPDAPRIRQNAYVTVGSLPLGLKDHSETYKGTRKAYPTLDSVKTTLETTVSNCDNNKYTVMPGNAYQTLRITNRLDNEAYTFCITMI